MPTDTTPEIPTAPAPEAPVIPTVPGTPSPVETQIPPITPSVDQPLSTAEAVQTLQSPVAVTASPEVAAGNPALDPNTLSATPDLTVPASVASSPDASLGAAPTLGGPIAATTEGGGVPAASPSPLGPESNPNLEAKPAEPKKRTLKNLFGLL
jgi:hypothetical protein